MTTAPSARTNDALRLISIVARSAVAALTATLLASCAQEQVATSGSPWSVPTDRPVEGFDPDRPIARPGGISQSTHVRTAVLPLGPVPYDNLSLPLVSPDGSYVVTQAGHPPTWPTLRAESRAEPPIDTQLHIYGLEMRDVGHGMGRVSLVTSVEEQVLLGRACNSEGFLVEGPRSDGSRWIGLCRWEDGAIEWLVTGIDVNAFATINQQGELAWCRRATGAEHFELVVRRQGGAEITLATEGQDWLMPVWPQQRDRLFAFHLRDGELSATYHSLSSRAAMRQPLYRLTLATGAAVDTAFQTMAPQPGSTATQKSGSDRLVFFHPALARTAIWQPLESPATQFIVIPGDSISAVVDELPYALVTSSEHLLRQNLLVPQDRQELLKGLLIPRPTTREDAPYVLLSPARPGQIGLTALNLLPVQPDR